MEPLQFRSWQVHDLHAHLLGVKVWTKHQQMPADPPEPFGPRPRKASLCRGGLRFLCSFLYPYLSTLDMSLWDEEWLAALTAADVLVKDDRTTEVDTRYLLLALIQGNGQGFKAVFQGVDLPVSLIREHLRASADPASPAGVDTRFNRARYAILKLPWGKRPQCGPSDYDEASNAFLKDLDTDMREGRVRLPFDGSHLALTLLQPQTRASQLLRTIGVEVEPLRDKARRAVLEAP